MEMSIQGSKKKSHKNCMIQKEYRKGVVSGSEDGLAMEYGSSELYAVMQFFALVVLIFSLMLLMQYHPN